MGKFTILIIIIILVLAGYFALRGNNLAEEPTGNTISPLIIGDNAIFAPDQKPGSDVNIGLAVFGEEGYVVIHEDSNGAPGKIIGSSELMMVGESQNVEIELSRLSRNGENLFAMLHKDNGDGSFNPAEDAPVVDETGNIILMRFLISEEATEPGAVSL